MNKINDNFLKLPSSYLFAEINRRIAEYSAQHPDHKLIRMGIGDVTLGLPSAVIRAMHEAVEDESKPETSYGYGPELGYGFLREAIVEHDYRKRGIQLDPSEVFISDGAKSDTANITTIFGQGVRIAITDPVYPVYVDSNAIMGRTGTYADGRWSQLIYLPCNRENGFVPKLPAEEVDLIYLCFPNNPTGTTLTRNQLKVWVDYARSHDVILLFDSAYEAFIREDDVPHSIYEIEGAQECAIEFRSYSKTAGFTGVRCGYTVVPHALTAKMDNGEVVELNRLWARRQSTMFNGASYISQRGAAAIYTEEGQAQTRANIDYYLHNATTIRRAFESAGYEVFGGISSPYIWVKTPDAFPESWAFFDYLLHEHQVIGTPGVGFGPEGEGYFRFSAFAGHEATAEAMQRILQK